jgi:2-polyprenyl-6-hydroxyphenyl methylase/3-demethylubiquinone-9 3-methyltransferase
MWKLEKRAYSVAPRVLQQAILHAFKACALTAIALRGRNPFKFEREYHGSRGMDWNHDLHDWLGGYPYESASAGEIESFFWLRAASVWSAHSCRRVLLA